MPPSDRGAILSVLASFGQDAYSSFEDEFLPDDDDVRRDIIGEKGVYYRETPQEALDRIYGSAVPNRDYSHLHDYTSPEQSAPQAPTRSEAQRQVEEYGQFRNPFA